MKKEHRTSGRVDVHVKGKNLTITAALQDQVVNKMHRLDKYLDRLERIDVELWTEHTREADQHNHVEATAHVLGRTIRVATVHSEMYAAVDEAVDKLYRQLNRHKERIKSHHGAKLADLLPGEEPETAPAPNGMVELEATAPELLVERLDVEPIFEDEAIEEFHAGQKPFLVFLNARNEQVNVLYRRQDGHYGLIEPRVH